MAKRYNPPEWMRLDNAAKIYPAVKTRNWTSVYRLSVTLTEEIDPTVLEQALQATLKRIPFFGYRLRRGLFWFYIDKQMEKLLPIPDVQNPCSRMPLDKENRFMIRVRYYDCRIALEIFHALADATGAMTFLMTMAAEYVRLMHGIRTPKGPYILDTRDKPQPEEWEDSFLRYARSGTRDRNEDKAYRLQGTKTGQGELRLITGIVPTPALRAKAHEYEATVNVFLCAVGLQAMLDVQAEDHSLRRRKLPVKISMPVNLRSYYPSKTLRNFASYFNASVNPTYGDYSFKDLIRLVKYFGALEGMEQLVNARMSTNVSAEKNRLLRIVPLSLKVSVLKMMYALTGERYFTSTLSNLGQMSLPSPLCDHISRVDFILGPGKQNPVSCGVVSIHGKAYINFSRTIEEPRLERAFFTQLIRLGVPVVVESNRR